MSKIQSAWQIQIDRGHYEMVVPFYLMASYAYYEEDDPIVDDAFYDNMAKTLMEHWDNITHPHKEYINFDDLEAGSFLGKYPQLTIGALNHVRRNVV